MPCRGPDTSGSQGSEGCTINEEVRDPEDLFLSAVLFLMEAVRQSDCSQSYFIGCSHDSKLLGFLRVPNRKANIPQSIPFLTDPLQGILKSPEGLKRSWKMPGSFGQFQIPCSQSVFKQQFAFMKEPKWGVKDMADLWVPVSPLLANAFASQEGQKRGQEGLPQPSTASAPWPSWL